MLEEFVCQHLQYVQSRIKACCTCLWGLLLLRCRGSSPHQSRHSWRGSAKQTLTFIQAGKRINWLIRTINVPVVYMAWDAMILMRTTLITRANVRGGPWNGNERNKCHMGPFCILYSVFCILCSASTHYTANNFWYFVRNYVIPKGIMKTRFEPRPPGMSLEKNNKFHTLGLNSGPLHQKQVFRHWIIKTSYIKFPQSCPSEDPNWGNKSAKPVKVTGKNDSPW